MRLSEEQKLLIAKLNKNGCLTLEDFFIYTTPHVRKANIEKFIYMKLMKESNIVGKWIKIKNEAE